MTDCALAQPSAKDYLAAKAGPRNAAGSDEETPMLYILENRNRLAIAWNGRAPQQHTVARWEVLNLRSRFGLKKI
ncbi:hypothetical protein IP76_12595 [Rhizobium sp. AAP43]|nr:hypothetical protein IP76_12595 [Rhizobium sp. AAP43]